MEQYLFFKLNGILYAIDRLTISEVARLKDYAISPMPCSGNKCIGAIQHRGKIVPVVSGSGFLLLDHPNNQPLHPDTRLIFFPTNCGELAITVDHITNDTQALADALDWQFIQLADFL